MNPVKSTLSAGLYLIATPIGSARDITLRALDILTAADVLVAEDTRSLRKLMEIHGVALNSRTVLSYHDHSGAKTRQKLIDFIQSGQSVVYASEAGTPLIADPGFDLVRDVRAAKCAVTSAPGPSAVIAALSLAGLPTDRFLFAGFLPSSKGKRQKELLGLAHIPATLVFYESPNRIEALLKDAVDILGLRAAVLCRELTKKFEELREGTLHELLESVKSNPPRGEIVLVIDRPKKQDITEDELITQLKKALKDHTLRDAVDQVTKNTGEKRKIIYNLALSLTS